MPRRVTEVEQHYRPATAAKLASLSVHTINKAVQNRDIEPVIKPGRNITLIPASSLQAYLDARAV